MWSIVSFFLSLYNSGVNLSVIMLLRFWYSNSFFQLRSAADTIIRIQRGARQGGVLSPTLFKICISSVLAKISGSYPSGLADASYLAYADDLLLISRSKKGLSQMVFIVFDAFSDIALSLNIDKCKFLPYNCTTATPLHCNNFTIPLVDCIRWLGISITNNISSLRQPTVCDISKKIQIGYAKIVANRGKYNRRGLAKLFSTFCDYSVLYASLSHFLIIVI